jgi:hypothetical protein
VAYLTYSIDGWAGDHAGSVVGRKPNTLLISVTQSVEAGYSGPLPPDLYTKRDLDGVPWYPNVKVRCLTPNTLSAFATSVTNDHGFWGNVFAIEVRPIDWGRGDDPWTPGVHLFSVTLASYPPQGGLIAASTIATAVISDRISPHSPDLEVVGPTLWSMCQEGLPGSPAQEWPGSAAPPDRRDKRASSG